jgi:uncharacterized protein
MRSNYIEQTRGEVTKLLGTDNSGHGMGHIDRVHALSLRFLGDIPAADPEIVSLASLLHDVDDYKIVGREKAEKLENTRRILAVIQAPGEIATAVCGIVSTMGYSKLLRGIRPQSIEGQIVSDADMNDAIGAVGVVRSIQYALSDKGSGVLFDPRVWPNVDMTAEQYNANGTTYDGDSAFNHFFEKLLKIKGIMMTEPGRQEAAMRDEAMVSFLRNFYRENFAPEWSNYLENYLNIRETHHIQ